MGDAPCPAEDMPIVERLIRFPLDQSGKRISQPARRLSEVDIRHPEGINRMSYQTASQPAAPFDKNPGARSPYRRKICSAGCISRCSRSEAACVSAP